MSKKYTTPKGVAEQIIDELPDQPNYRVMNWRGSSIIVGPGRGPFFFNQLAERSKNNKSNIFAITGAPGSGKTYFGLAVAQALDKDFDVTTQVVFRRDHLLNLLGKETPLKRGSVILCDESQYSMGSRRWYEDIQKDIMESLEAVRSKGYIIIIVALHLQLLDVIIRKYVLSYMVHMERRGQGTVYRLYTPRFEREMRKRRLGTVKLLLPDYEKCSRSDCLECPYRERCMTSRAVYERLKKAFVNERNRIAELKAIQKQSRETPLSDAELVEKIMPYSPEFLLTNRGTVEKTSIQYLLEKKLGIVISRSKAETLARRIGMEYPNLSKTREEKGA